MKNNPLEVPFYFWLGADGELESLTEEEFKAKEEDSREQRRKWLEVDAT